MPSIDCCKTSTMHLPLLLASLTAAVSSAATSPPAGKSCKAHPRGPDWPSARDWKRLNETLGGRLIKPAAPAAACHPGNTGYGPARCDELTKAWQGTEFHCGNPVSVLLDQYTNYTCLPDAAYPCTAEGYPAYVVNATTAEHIKLGVDFARRQNVRLVVKGTGHDFLGRSIAPGALSIWTHHLRDAKYHAGKFRLSGSGRVIRGNAMTFGAGTRMFEAYAAADKHGQAVVGGYGRTVGIVGYVTGGGHSPLGPRYGMAADNVLEMLVVTPAGKVVAVNEDRHPDLFWAMRGGGGSTFGVVVSVTLRTYPTPQVTSAGFVVFTDPKERVVANELLALISSQFPALMDKGLSGYVFLSPGMKLPTSVPDVPPEIAGAFGTVLVQDAADRDAAIPRILKPLNETIHERWPGKVTLMTFPKHYKTFLEWYNENHDAGSGGGSSYVASRLLERDVLQGNSTRFPSALKEAFKANKRFDIFMVGGKGVRDAQPRGGSNAVHPAWRRAAVQGMTSVSFPPLNKTAEQDAKKLLDGSFQPMRDLSPRSGSYINEAFLFEKNWQRAFWGDNYPRLLRVKKAVDPSDVFWCKTCVGSEGWAETQDGELCKLN
ncbi:FAD-binding, type 2 [Purpureocillium lavendulum]|uniref:FAD-binding, type 2 n=1 Tax=Purpureocillium lavendulum TaxID=1247861 RepID=A0AB34G3Z6_9HYPO|nr:FAD-binding, type 2 [Purpureocillium lavendulum]